MLYKVYVELSMLGIYRFPQGDRYTISYFKKTLLELNISRTVVIFYCIQTVLGNIKGMDLKNPYFRAILHIKHLVGRMAF